MSNRLALPLIALFLLAVASWVILDDGPISQDLTGDNSVSQNDTDLEEAPDLSGSDLSGSDNDSSSLERTDVEIADSGTDGPGDLADLDYIPSFLGRIIDEAGNPVEGVEVFAMAMVDWARTWDESRNVLPADWTGTSNADGYFALPEPPRERLRFMLEFRHPDFATFELFNQPSTPGRTRDLGVLTMDAGFSLTGTVLDPNGGAVAGALVTPFRGGSPEGFNPADKNNRPLLEPVYTDDRGSFTLVRLPTQPVRLLASAETYFEAWSQTANGESGEELDGMEIHLAMATPASGYIMDEARAPVVSAKIEVRDSRWEEGVEAAPFLTTTESDAQGRFALLIPDGASRTSLTVGAEGYFVSYKRLDDDATSGPIEVILAPIKPLIGVVVDEAGSAVSGATVSLLQSRGNMADPRNAIANATTISDAEGGFELLPNLKSAWGGRFMVYAWDDDHAIGSSQLLRIRESKTVLPELRVVLKRGFRAAGVVVDASGQPHAGAHVQLRKLKRPRNSKLPQMNESQRGGDIVERAIADADGAFEFTNLPSGDYRLETYAKGFSPGQSEDFGLVDMDFETELQLIESCGISGEVIGDISAFRQLRITANSPGMERLEVFADGNGRFEFLDMMPGAWNLALTDASDLTYNPTFTFNGGEPLARLSGVEVMGGQMTPAVIELDVGALGTVSGIVRINGEPQPNYAVFVVPQLTAGSDQGGIGRREIMRHTRSVATDYQGRYSIAGLEPNDYWVMVENPNNWPDFKFEAGNSAPEALQRSMVHLPDAGTVENDFDFYLGSLNINIANPKGSDRTSFRLVPSPADGRRTRSGRISRNGYSLHEITSGAYDLFVLVDGSWQSYVTSVPNLSTGNVSVSLPESKKKPNNTKKQKR
jgi:hypothetical protein